MARKRDDENTTPATDEAVEATVEAETETPAEVENTPDAPTEGEATDGTPQEAPAEEAKPEEADLSAFEAAAAEAVSKATANGDLPDGAIDPVLEQYRALPTVKDRNRAKNVLKDKMAETMQASNLPGAKAYYTLGESMTTATGKTPAERKPQDPLAAWKHNLMVSTIAYGQLAGPSKPEGADAEAVVAEANSPELVEKINAYREWLDTEVPEGEEKPDAPEVPAEVVAAFKLIRGNKRVGVGRGNGVRTPHDGPRRDLGKHIAEAFAEVHDGGFLSVAEIRKFKSSEYGDEEPSAGAISARLFPATGSCTIEGLVPGTGGEKGTKGAYKGHAPA